VFESYRPELFEAERAPAILDVLVSGLAPHIDVWLIETQSSTAEAGVAMAAAARRAKLPVWVSYTLRDEAGRRGPPELRSGESVERAVSFGIECGAQAILFNCSQPEVMNAAVRSAAVAIAASAAAADEHGAIRIGVYANAFSPEPATAEPYAGISELRHDLTPQRYLKWADEWVGLGATLVGGCCGIGPEHIAELRANLP
jgi:S-methylmethionine-dependent homocysteine/selenocysteine methylase